MSDQTSPPDGGRSAEQRSHRYPPPPPPPQYPPPGPPPPASAMGAGGAAGPTLPATPPPPRRRRGLLAGLIAAAVLVVVVVVVIAANSAGTSSGGAGSQTSGSTSPADVSFQIVNALDPTVEIAEACTVFSQGRNVGTLNVDTSSPTATLPVTAPSGPVDYELSVTMQLVNGKIVDLGGKGTLNAYAGATYAVALTPSGSGFDVTLREQGS